VGTGLNDRRMAQRHVERWALSSSLHIRTKKFFLEINGTKANCLPLLSAKGLKNKLSLPPSQPQSYFYGYATNNIHVVTFFLLTFNR
jgi:hypothetical protein